MRHLYAGIEHADSFVVDPHKWFFAPFDCCALLYRDPALAKAAHTQKAGYLDVLTDSDDWNPVGLRDRADPAGARPAVLVLAGQPRQREVHRGRRAHADRHPARRPRDQEARVRRAVARAGPVRRRVPADRLDPQQYQIWSDRLLAANFAFVVPTTHEGETVTRFAIVNPRTTKKDINAILDTMA